MAGGIHVLEASMDRRSTGCAPYLPLRKTQWPLIQPGTLAMHWLKRAERRVSRRFAAILKGYALIDSEWQALREMYKPGRTSPLAIAGAIGMSKGGASKLIARLVYLDMVRKEVDPLDRRRRVLGLTELGERIVPILASAEITTDEEFFRPLKSPLPETLRRALKLTVVAPPPETRHMKCWCAQYNWYDCSAGPGR